MDRLMNNLSNLMLLKEGTFRSFSFENPTAKKGGAGRAASELGRSRKGAPFIRELMPGETAILADADGPGVIRHFFITVTDLTPHGSLKRLILRMFWDGEEKPAVECSLGAFFGCGDGEIREYSSLEFAVIPARSFHCYIPMPFRKRACVTLENQYEEAISVVAYQVDCTVNQSLPDEIRYFRMDEKGYCERG